jgi:hypothetical protein
MSTTYYFSEGQFDLDPLYVKRLEFQRSVHHDGRYLKLSLAQFQKFTHKRHMKEQI